MSGETVVVRVSPPLACTTFFCSDGRFDRICGAPADVAFVDISTDRLGVLGGYIICPKCRNCARELYHLYSPNRASDG